MKNLLLLILSLTCFSTFSAEKLVFSVECSWDDSENAPKAIFKLFEDGKNQWLENATELKHNLPPYVLKAKGAYVKIGKDEYYKEYYWQSDDIRLTLLRGENTLIKIESVSNPNLDELSATCPKPDYEK